MGGSRRRLKRSRAKVRLGLPRKNPNVFKPAFCLPPKLRALLDPSAAWDDTGTVVENYKSFGVVSNPNLLSVRSRTPHLIELDSLQVPPPRHPSETGDGDGGNATGPADEFEPIESGSDLEEDDLKTALGKKRRDGKSTHLQPLTSLQRTYIKQLVEKYGDDYQGMFKDTKLNRLQHSVATLEKLCRRYRMFKDKNLMIVAPR